MKRNIKALIASLIVLALLAGLYILAVKMPDSNEKVPESDTTEKINYLVDVEIADIDSVEVNNGKETYVIKNAEPPYIVGDTSPITDTGKVVTSVYVAAGIMISEEIENPKDLSSYGLDREDKTFRVRLKDGSEHFVVIGNNSGIQNEYYVMNKTTGTVATVAENVAMVLTQEKVNFKSIEVPKIDNEKIKALSIAKGGKKEFSIEADSERGQDHGDFSNYFVMTYPYEGAEIAAGKVKELFEAITEPEIFGLVAENPKDLSRYGLDKPYVITVTDAERTVSYKMGKYAKGSNIYLMYDDVDAVFLAHCEFYEMIKEAVADEYTDKFIHLFTRNEVSKLTIQNGEKSSVLMRDEKGNFTIGEKKISSEKFGEIYGTVVGITAARFSEGVPSGKEKCRVSFEFTNGERKTFVYYDYNERNCIVKSDSGMNCIVLKKDIDAAVKAFFE